MKVANFVAILFQIYSHYNLKSSFKHFRYVSLIKYIEVQHHVQDLKLRIPNASLHCMLSIIANISLKNFVEFELCT